MTGSLHQDWFLQVESRNNLFREIDYRVCAA
jgi:hypothetical protein